MSNALTEKSHKPLSASITERWWNCPGSIAMSKQAPSEVPNKYAAEGTYAHMLAELELKLRLGRQTKEETRLWNEAQKGHMIDGFRFSWNEELRSAIEEYVEYILDVRDHYKISNDYIQTESKFDIPGDNRLGGTADCAIHVPYRRLIVVDFKYGAGNVVEVIGNKQLMTYALGAYFALEEEDREEIPILRIVVIQPRVPQGIQEWEFTTGALLQFQKDLLAHAKRTDTESGTLNAGPWCKYCPAVLGCPENERFTTDKVGIEFAAVPVTPNYTELSTERMSEIYNAIPVVEDFIKNFKQFVLGKAINGTEIPGWRLKESLGNRKWTMGDDGHIKFLDIKNCNKFNGVELFTRELKSPAQIEKLAKQKKIKIDLSDLTTREITGHTLVKDTGSMPKIEVMDPFAAIKPEEEF